MTTGKLYLCPTPIGVHSLIFEEIKKLVCETRHFVVETEKDARRFLKLCGYDLQNNYPKFYLLNEHQTTIDASAFLAPLLEGKNMILMSDAGLPCVADPGFQFVKICQQHAVEILPLSGSSSIMLALMASGFSGQQFTFHGYLPIDKNQRNSKLRHLESEAIHHKYAQIFIETPYRNNQLMKDLLETLQPTTLICVAYDIEGESQMIQTKSVVQWKKSMPVFEKKPSVFILGL